MDDSKFPKSNQPDPALDQDEEKMRRALGLDAGVSQVRSSEVSPFGRPDAGQPDIGQNDFRRSDRQDFQRRRAPQFGGGFAQQAPAAPQFGQGASASGTQHRRRFVRDGEVQVTVIGSGESTRAGAAGAAPGHRLQAAETALAAERAERERLERLVSEAQASIHELKTKLGHQSLAHDDIVRGLKRDFDEALDQARLATDTLQAQLDTERAARARAEQALVRFRPAPIATVDGTEIAILPRKRGRPRKFPLPVPQAIVAPDLLSLEAEPAFEEAKAVQVEVVRAVPVQAEIKLEPRRRGRPPGSGRKAAADKLAAPKPVVAVEKKARVGRPPKADKPVKWWIRTDDAKPVVAKPTRGRPRKQR